MRAPGQVVATRDRAAVDLVLGVLAGEQPVATLGDREAAPGEKIERVEVSGARGFSRQTG